MGQTFRGTSAGTACPCSRCGRCPWLELQGVLPSTSAGSAPGAPHAASPSRAHRPPEAAGSAADTQALEAWTQRPPSTTVTTCHSSEHHRAGPGPGEGRQTSFRSTGRLKTWWWEAITSLTAVSHRVTWKMRHLYPVDELVHRVLTFVFSMRSLAVTVSSASHLLCKYPSFFPNTFNIPPNKNYDCVCLHGIYGESRGRNFGWYIAFHAFWNKTFCPKLESSIPETLQNTHCPGKWRVTHKDAGTPGPH